MNLYSALKNELPWVAAAVVLVAAPLTYLLLPQARSNQRKATGIINEGNTCFANSIFQAIVGSSLLRSFILSLEDSEISLPLKRLIEQVAKSADQPVSAFKFFSAFEDKYKGIFNYQQQDAHQFFLLLLRALDDLLSKVRTPSIISEGIPANPPYEGICSVDVHCLECNKQLYTRAQKFFAISFELDKQSNTLIDLFVKYESKELVDGYDCPSCRITSTITLSQNIMESSSTKQHHKESLGLMLNQLRSCSLLHYQQHQQLDEVLGDSPLRSLKNQRKIFMRRRISRYPVISSSALSHHPPQTNLLRPFSRVDPQQQVHRLP